MSKRGEREREREREGDPIMNFTTYIVDAGKER